MLQQTTTTNATTSELAFPSHNSALTRTVRDLERDSTLQVMLGHFILRKTTCSFPFNLDHFSVIQRSPRYDAHSLPERLIRQPRRVGRYADRLEENHHRMIC